MIVNWTGNVATLMIENGRPDRAKVKKKLQLGKESFLAKSTSWKPWELSEDLAGKSNLSHARRTLALDW